MGFLCWNCRGLANRWTVQELGDIIRAQDPSVVFLVETWLDEARLGIIRDSLQFGHHHGVSKITRGGGLALFWKKNFNVSVESSSLNHIDVVINKGKEKLGASQDFTMRRRPTYEMRHGICYMICTASIHCLGCVEETLTSY